MFIFFLEHAGELHIIILRRKKGYEPLQKPTHIHASSLTQNKRNFINKETTLICAQCLLGTEVRRWVIPRALAKPQECSSSLASNKALATFEDAPSNTHLLRWRKNALLATMQKRVGGAGVYAVFPFHLVNQCYQRVPLDLKFASRFFK